jgi:hypothetical protein
MRGDRQPDGVQPVSITAQRPPGRHDFIHALVVQLFSPTSHFLSRT